MSSELIESASHPSQASQSARNAIQPGDIKTDAAFIAALCVIGATYVLLIIAMLVADASFTSPEHLRNALSSREIKYAIQLSLISCTVTSLLSLFFAIPIGYIMSRYRFKGKGLLDAVLDIPIVLPPLVVGLSLLILMQTRVGRAIEDSMQALIGTRITYAVPSVILAQFSVSCAFAVRTLRVTFDQISPRSEQVALTLGCSRAQAFWMVVLPEARRGILTAATLAWARALGEFGPILIFSGATRMRTEVLPTTVFLELSVGNIEAAVAVSLLMVTAAIAVLLLVRVYGSDRIMGRAER